MRARVLAVVSAAALAPVAILALTHWGEERHRARVDVDLLSALDEVCASMPPDERAIARVAEDRGVRVRVVDVPSGRVVLEVDRERGSQPPRVPLAWLLFPDDVPTLAEVERDFAPLADRTEVTDARPRGSEVGCRSDPRGVLLVCHASRRVGERVVLVEQGMLRGVVRALFERKRELGKLILIVLPIALLLGVWLTRRLLRPLEALREEALERARAVDPSAPLSFDRSDEIGDVAQALNALLGALAAKDRATEAFVADLAHEVKNPIASIQACAEALSSGPVDDAKRERLASNLRRSGQRLDGVVTELLELARVEGGMPDEVRGEVDLARLTRGVVESVGGGYPEVRLEVEGPDEVVVTGVPLRLETVLRNLVENAASFAREQVVVSIEATETGARVSVSDDGPGIDAAALPRVFDRFFTTRGSRRGTGLGLAMVRAVVEAHGGRIEARSAAGATFELELPSARRPR